MRKDSKGRLKVAVSEGSKGVKCVDLFVDHIAPHHRINAIASQSHTISDYLRIVMAPVSCPQCGSRKMQIRVTANPATWLLKLSGRRVFFCPDCNARQAVKVHRWEWEVVGTALAVSFVLAAFAFRWFLH